MEFHILRTDDHVNKLIASKSRVHTWEWDPQDLHQKIFRHHTVNDIAFPDKIRNKSVFRFIINVHRCADLLDQPLVHDDDPVGHSQSLFLVMGNEYEGDSQLIFDFDQFLLHILSELQIQRPQRFVQKEDLRLINDSPGDSDPLLLSA